jgi:hypothetical protein
VTFPSLEDALHAGFQVYGVTERGYVVRMRTAAGWVRATVDVSMEPHAPIDHLKSEGAQAKR